MDAREELQKLLDALSTQRDELIVRAHLAKLEAEDEWREMEGKLERLRDTAAKVADTANSAGEDVLAAARLLGEEIARGYRRLRDLF
ncbi:MAG: hypothetical protein AB1831_06600 [Pseudomonadota bacterium]